MSTPAEASTKDKHSPYRIVVIGAVLTTVGSIITGVTLNYIGGDSKSDSSAALTAGANTTTRAGRASSRATPILDPAHAPKFVAELGGDLTVDSAVEINGEKFLYGAAGHCDQIVGCHIEYDGDFIELNLGRDYKTFRATLGLSDRSEGGGTRHMRVLADGVLLYEREFGLGQSEAVTLNVSGALRLRIEVLGGIHVLYGAIGDPTVE